MTSKWNSLLNLAILLLITSNIGNLWQKCNFFIPQISKHCLSVNFEDFGFPFVYIQKGWRKGSRYIFSQIHINSLKMPQCEGVFEFWKYKSPILITLGKELSRKMRILKKFSRQRYTKRDDSNGSAPLK